MDQFEQVRDRQELDALREEILNANAAMERANQLGNSKAAIGYARKIQEYRRRSNAICDRLWPATVSYTSAA